MLMHCTKLVSHYVFFPIKFLIYIYKGVPRILVIARFPNFLLLAHLNRQKGGMLPQEILYSEIESGNNFYQRIFTAVID